MTAKILASNTWALSMSKMLIIGEFYRSSFSDGPGPFLRGLLSAAGADPREVHYTNLFNLRPKGRLDISSFGAERSAGIPGYPSIAPKLYIDQKYAPEIERLYEEIRTIKPNIIVCLAASVVAVLTRKPARIGSARGTIILSPHTLHADGTPIKLICIYHPLAIMADFSLRPVAIKDLAKAIKHSASPEYVRKSRELWLAPTLEDLEKFSARYIIPHYEEPWGVDIETARGTITEIGFALPHVGIVIPFYSRLQKDGNYWRSSREEILAWQYVRVWLHNLRRPVFQNGLYDINYLWSKMGIKTRWAGEDTMLIHHALQPEMKKGLEFLGSIYADEPHWKKMRKDNETMKKED